MYTGITSSWNASNSRAPSSIFLIVGKVVQCVLQCVLQRVLQRVLQCALQRVLQCALQCVLHCVLQCVLHVHVLHCVLQCVLHVHVCSHVRAERVIFWYVNVFLGCLCVQDTCMYVRIEYMHVNSRAYK